MTSSTKRIREEKIETVCQSLKMENLDESVDMLSNLQGCFLKMIVCPVCLEKFQTPKSLSCLHTFCLSCLEKVYSPDQREVAQLFDLYGLDPDEEDFVRCPTCREICTLPKGGVVNLPDNFIISTLMNTHDTGGQHEFCDKHRHCMVEFYCFDCETTLCSTCFDAHARDHKVKTKSEAFEVLHSEVDSCQRRIRHLYPVVGYVEKMKQAKTAFIEHADTVMNNIRMEGSALTELVDDHLKKLLDDVTAFKSIASEVVYSESRKNQLIYFHMELEMIQRRANGLTNIKVLSKESVGRVEALRKDVDELILKHSKYAKMELRVNRTPDIMFALSDVNCGNTTNDENCVGTLSLVKYPQGGRGDRWYSLRPSLLQTLTVLDDAIHGITRLDGKIFVALARQLAVFEDCPPYNRLPDIALALNDDDQDEPDSIVACKYNHRLYVAMWDKVRQFTPDGVEEECTIGVSDSNGVDMTPRSLSERSGRLLVRSSSVIDDDVDLDAVEDFTTLTVYDLTDGSKRLLSVKLGDDDSIASGVAATGRGTYIVACGKDSSFGRSLGHVLEMDQLGNKIRSAPLLNVNCCYFVPTLIDVNDQLLVVDEESDRVLLLDKDLKVEAVLLSRLRDGLECPRYACYDEATGQLIVSSGESSIKIYNIVYE